MKKILLIVPLVLMTALIYLYGPLAGSSIPFKEPMLTFRFDDAWANQVKAAEILSRKGIPATFYPIGSFIGKPGYMTKKNLQRLARLGHEIGYHSDNHANLLLKTGQGHREEIIPGKSIDFLSQKIKTFAFPYGLYNPLFLSQVRERYQGACVYPVIRGGTLNRRGSDPWLLDCIEINNYRQFQKLLKKTIERRLWLIACFHRIETAEGPWSCSLEELERVVQYASAEAQKERIRVVTVAEGLVQLKE